MRFPRILAVAFATVPVLPVAASSPSPADLREFHAQWLAQEKRLAEARVAADESAAAGRQFLAALVAEEQALQAIVDAAGEAASQAEVERARLQTERDSVRAASGSVVERLPELETQLLALAPRLPAPLRARVDALVSRIGRPNAPVTERLQNVVGTMMQVDKFASGLHLETEVVEHEGRSVEVRTLYFGLAGAVFADASGAYAGRLRPGESGWTREMLPGDAPAILEAIRVYTDPQLAKFVGVPVVLD